MRREPISDHVRAEIRRLTGLGQSVRTVAKALGVGSATATKYGAKRKRPSTPPMPPRKFVESGDAAQSEFASRTPIRTLDDAIKHGEVDTSVWMVDRWECTAWEMGFVRKDGEAASLPLWRVKLYLKRILPKPLLDASEAIYERLAGVAPKQFADTPAVIIARPVMMSLDLMDVHFGKLAWKPETGEDYDLKIAEKRFRTAVARLVEHTSPYSIAETIIPVGNDLCHVDNMNLQTTAGTQVDTDGRHAKVVTVTVTALIQMVEYVLRKSHTVKIKQIPGNHDFLTSWFICRELKAYFRHCDRVEVDVEPTSRKYAAWGKNLIGYTHGKEVKDPRDLASIMIHERPQEFVGSVCREWHLGHLHQHRSSERFGVVFRIIRALSGSDSFHVERGYIGNQKAAECYLYDKSNGLIGNFIAGAE